MCKSRGGWNVVQAGWKEKAKRKEITNFQLVGCGGQLSRPHLCRHRRALHPAAEKQKQNKKTESWKTEHIQ